MRILNTLPNGVRLAHHNTLIILSNLMQNIFADYKPPYPTVVFHQYPKKGVQSELIARLYV
mgnify:FL=1